MGNCAVILKIWKPWTPKNQIGLKRYCQNKQTQIEGTQEHIENMICVKGRVRSQLQPASLVFWQSFLEGGAELYSAMGRVMT